MARPLSEAKRQAILDAAADLIASRGVAVSTAAIAKRAGVSEGALFIYFPTKDDLLNQLLIEIKAQLAGAIVASFPATGHVRERLQLMWRRMIAWGTGNLNQYRAMNRLKQSERISEESNRRCYALVRETLAMLETSLAGQIKADRIGFYLGPILDALVETTVEAIAAAPEKSRSLEEAGFEMFWNGLAIWTPAEPADA